MGAGLAVVLAGGAGCHRFLTFVLLSLGPLEVSSIFKTVFVGVFCCVNAAEPI